MSNHSDDYSNLLKMLDQDTGWEFLRIQYAWKNLRYDFTLAVEVIWNMVRFHEIKTPEQIVSFYFPEGCYESF